MTLKVSGPNGDKRQVMTDLTTEGANKSDWVSVIALNSDLHKAYKQGIPRAHLGLAYDKSQNKYMAALKDLKVNNFTKAAFNHEIADFVKRNQRTLRGNALGGEASHAAGGARQWSLASSFSRLTSVGFAVASAIAVPPLIIPASVFGLISLVFTNIAVARGEKGEADGRMLSHDQSIQREFIRQVQIINDVFALNLSPEQIDTFAQRQATRFVHTIAEGVDFGRLKLSALGSLLISPLLILPALQDLIDTFEGQNGLITVASVYNAAQVGRRALAIQAVYSHIASGVSFNEALEQIEKSQENKTYQFTPGWLNDDENIEIAKKVDNFYTLFYQDLNAIAPKGIEISAKTVKEKVDNLTIGRTDLSDFEKLSLTLNQGNSHDILDNIVNKHLNKTGQANAFYQHSHDAIKHQTNEIKKQLAILKQAEKADHNVVQPLIESQINAIQSNQNDLFEKAILFFKDLGYIPHSKQINIQEARKKGWVNALLVSYEKFQSRGLSSQAKSNKFLSSFDKNIQRLVQAIHEDRTIQRPKGLNKRFMPSVSKFIKNTMKSNQASPWDETVSSSLIKRLQASINQFEKEAVQSQDNDSIREDFWQPSQIENLKTALTLTDPEATVRQIKYGPNGIELVKKTPAEKEIEKLEAQLRLLEKKQDWLLKSENTKVAKQALHAVLLDEENHNLRPFIRNPSQAHLASYDSSIAKPSNPENKLHWSNHASLLVKTIENHLGQGKNNYITSNEIVNIYNNKSLQTLALRLVQNYSRTSKAFANASDKEKKQLSMAFLDKLVIHTIDSASAFMGEQFEPITQASKRRAANSIASKNLPETERIYLSTLAKTYFAAHNDAAKVDPADRTNELTKKHVQNIDAALQYPRTPETRTTGTAIATTTESTTNAQPTQAPVKVVVELSPSLVHSHLLKFTSRETDKLTNIELDLILEAGSSPSFIEMAKKTYGLGHEKQWDKAIIEARNLFQQLNELNTEETEARLKEKQALFLQAHNKIRDNGTSIEEREKLAQTVPFVIVSMLKQAGRKLLVDENKKNKIASERAYVLFNDWLRKVDQGKQHNLEFEDKKYYTIVQKQLETELKDLADTVFQIPGGALTQGTRSHETSLPPTQSALIKMLISARRSKDNPELAKNVPLEHIKKLVNWQHLLLPGQTKAQTNSAQAGVAFSRNIQVNRKTPINPEFKNFIVELARSQLNTKPPLFNFKLSDNNSIARKTLDDLKRFIPNIAQQPAWLTPELTIQKHQNQPQQYRQRQAKVMAKLLTQAEKGHKPLKPSQLRQLAELSIVLTFEAQQQHQNQKNQLQNKPLEAQQKKVFSAFESWTKQPKANLADIAHLKDKLGNIMFGEIKMTQAEKIIIQKNLSLDEPSSESVSSIMTYYKNNPDKLKEVTPGSLDKASFEKVEAVIRLFQTEVSNQTLDARRMLALNVFDTRNNAIANHRADIALYYPYNDFEIRVKEALIERYQNNGQIKLAKKLIKNQYSIPSINYIENKDRRAMVAKIDTTNKKPAKFNRLGLTFGLNVDFHKKVLNALNPISKEKQPVKRSSAGSINTLIQDSLGEKRITTPISKAWLNDLRTPIQDSLNQSRNQGRTIELFTEDIEDELNKTDKDNEFTAPHEKPFVFFPSAAADLIKEGALNGLKEALKGTNIDLNAITQNKELPLEIALASNNPEEMFHYMVSQGASPFRVDTEKVNTTAQGLIQQFEKQLVDAIKNENTAFLSNLHEDLRSDLYLQNHILSNDPTKRVYELVRESNNEALKKLFNEVEA